MKNKLYLSICSALISGCAAPQTSFVDYPVVVDGVKSTYTKDSNGDCYLKMPQEDGREWRLYNQGCDETADSVALSFQEQFLFQYDRQDLDSENKNFFDSLFQEALEYQQKKNTKRAYNEIPF